MSYILSYVNDHKTDTTYDRAFTNWPELAEFVEANHPEFVSYQVIVTNYIAKVTT